MEPGHNTSWPLPSGPYGQPTAMIGAHYVKNLGIEHLIGQLCYNLDIIVSGGIKVGEFIWKWYAIGHNISHKTIHKIFGKSCDPKITLG